MFNSTKTERFLRDDTLAKKIMAAAQKQRNESARKYADNQSAIVKQNKELGGNRIKGFGVKTMEIDFETYMHWVGIDPFFWDDKSNIKKLRESNKELFVQTYAKD